MPGFFHGAFKTSPPSARGSSKTSSFLRREFLPLAEGFLQEVSWTIPCAMSSRAFPSPFAFKKAEKKALFKFVYSRTRAYGTGTTKAPPVSPQGSGKRSFAPSLPFGRTKGFPALNRNQPSTPGHSVKSLFPSRSFNAGTGKPELCRINRHMFLPPALVSLHTHDGTVWNMNLFSRFFPVPPGTVKTDSIAQSAPYLQRKPVPASRSHKAGAWQQPTPPDSQPGINQ